MGAESRPAHVAEKRPHSASAISYHDRATTSMQQAVTVPAQAEYPVAVWESLALYVRVLALRVIEVCKGFESQLPFPGKLRGTVVVARG